MNTAVYSIGRKLSGDDFYIISLYDLEPSGILVKAYNQAHSFEYSLSVSEEEVFFPFSFVFCLFTCLCIGLFVWLTLYMKLSMFVCTY